MVFLGCSRILLIRSLVVFQFFLLFFLFLKSKLSRLSDNQLNHHSVVIKLFNPFVGCDNSMCNMNLGDGCCHLKKYIYYKIKKIYFAFSTSDGQSKSAMKTCGKERDKSQSPKRS